MMKFPHDGQRLIGCLMLFLLMLAVACHSPKVDEPLTVLVGDLFTVGVGETAVLPTENLTITFAPVIEDSRCPTQVNCAESGQAHVAVMVQQGESQPVTLEFNTNPAPTLNQQSLTFGEYVVALQSLDPYPQDPNKPIEIDDYRVTLIVTRLP